MKDIFISKSRYADTTFDSYEKYKKAVLLGQLCLLISIICVAYVILDSLLGRFQVVPYYLMCAVTSGLVIIINRQGHFKLASTIFLSIMILLLYVFTDNDQALIGTHMYLVVYGLVAITLYGYENIAWSICFLLVTLVCFYIAYFADLPPIIQAPPLTEPLKQTYFIANFFIILSLSSLLVFFLISINFKANKAIWQKTQQLSKANNDLDRFVYNASHDLKAPLNSLTGLVELSKHSQDLAEVKTYLQMMTKSIGNLDTFIHEIIDYSRNAKTELKLEKFNLLELTKDVGDALKFSQGFEKVKMIYSIPTESLITSDSTRLKVVLNNIIGNAIKYHDPQQSDPWVMVRSTIHTDKLMIEVEDNGIGIDDQYKPKIFDMFFRANDTMKGSGLGLYIVKETLEKLGGRIDLTSQLGKGSVFRIELPLS